MAGRGVARQGEAGQARHGRAGLGMARQAWNLSTITTGDAMTDATTPQPPPQPGQDVVLFHVLDDLKRRAESGKAQYGTYLETFNNRNALVDAYQECLDMAMYLKQAIMEQEALQRQQYHREMQARIKELAK